MAREVESTRSFWPSAWRRRCGRIVLLLGKMWRKSSRCERLTRCPPPKQPPHCAAPPPLVWWHFPHLFSCPKPPASRSPTPTHPTRHPLACPFSALRARQTAAATPLPFCTLLPPTFACA
eukprot:353260-Chlamydomonas_euryale.AAC.2